MLTREYTNYMCKKEKKRKKRKKKEKRKGEERKEKETNFSVHHTYGN